jgi:hypothetical protein
LGHLARIVVGIGETRLELSEEGALLLNARPEAKLDHIGIRERHVVWEQLV